MALADELFLFIRWVSTPMIKVSSAITAELKNRPVRRAAHDCRDVVRCELGMTCLGKEARSGAHAQVCHGPINRKQWVSPAFTPGLTRVARRAARSCPAGSGRKCFGSCRASGPG